MKTRFKFLLVTCVIATVAITGFNFDQNGSNTDVSLADIAVMAKADGESGGGGCDFDYLGETIYYSDCDYEIVTTFQCKSGTGNVCFNGHSIVFYEDCIEVGDYDGVSTVYC